MLHRCLLLFFRSMSEPPIQHALLLWKKKKTPTTAKIQKSVSKRQVSGPAPSFSTQYPTSEFSTHSVTVQQKCHIVRRHTNSFGLNLALKTWTRQKTVPKDCVHEPALELKEPPTYATLKKWRSSLMCLGGQWMSWPAEHHEIESIKRSSLLRWSRLVKGSRRGRRQYYTITKGKHAKQHYYSIDTLNIYIIFGCKYKSWCPRNSPQPRQQLQLRVLRRQRW